jgi:hypothetical protein
MSVLGYLVQPQDVRKGQPVEMVSLRLEKDVIMVVVQDVRLTVFQILDTLALVHLVLDLHAQAVEMEYFNQVNNVIMVVSWAVFQDAELMQDTHAEAQFSQIVTKQDQDAEMEWLK